MPEGDTLFRTAAGLRPFLVGRDVTAAHVQGPGRSRRSTASSASASTRSRRTARTCSSASMGGWSSDPPADAGVVASLPTGRALAATAGPGASRLEVPGSVAVCFDAPVVELFEQRAEPSTGRSRGSA